MPTPSLDQLITEAEQWFNDTMHNSVVAREVAVYNHVHSAFEDLKSRIVTLFTGKPLTPPAPPEEPAVSEEIAAADEKTADVKPKPA